MISAVGPEKMSGVRKGEFDIEVALANAFSVGKIESRCTGGRNVLSKK